MAWQHKYDNLQADGDRENDQDLDQSSTTEVEESLVGDEKQWHQDHFRRRSQRPERKCFSIFKSWRWIIDTLLLIVIVGLLLRDQWHKTPKRSESDIGGDVTGFGQKFSTRVTTFKSNPIFAPYNTSEFFKPEVQEAWNALMPKGMGFQEVKDKAKYHDLPVPIKGFGSKSVYTTSLTHQLHCVFVMAQTYSGLTSNTTLPDDHHWHMIHCFDYLRQAIMCTADMAIEGLETTAPDHNGGSDGWDAKHVCKDYSQVISYLESVRPYQYDGAEIN